MMKNKITLIFIGLLLVITLTACNSESNISKAEKDVAEVNIKTAPVSKDKEKDANEENRAKQIAIEEIKYYFDLDIDNSYELKVNYFDYGDDSRYYQYLFWSDTNTFDVRVSKKEEKAFYLKQILPENHDGKLLNKEEAEVLSKDFIKGKLGSLADKLVLTNTDYEVIKDSSDIEYYVFQYNEKENEDSGVFIKVDCHNNYVTEITIFN